MIAYFHSFLQLSHNAKIFELVFRFQARLSIIDASALPIML